MTTDIHFQHLWELNMFELLRNLVKSSFSLRSLFVSCLTMSWNSSMCLWSSLTASSQGEGSSKPFELRHENILLSAKLVLELLISWRASYVHMYNFTGKHIFVTLQITQNNDNPDLKSQDGISSNKTQKARSGGTPKKKFGKVIF